MTAEREGLVEEIARVLGEHRSSRPAFIREADGNDWHQGVSVCTCGSTFTGSLDLHLADALADLLAARDRRVRGEALREAADEVAAIERYGQSTSDELTDEERERWMLSPLNRLWAVDGKRPRPIVEQWLHDRADRIEGEG